MSALAEISSEMSDEVSTQGSIRQTQLSIRPAWQLSTQQSELTQPTQSSQRLRWTDLMEDALLDFLRQEVNLGKRADNSFKKGTWEAGVVAVQAVMLEVRT